jgi:hypothetical protein
VGNGKTVVLPAKRKTKEVAHEEENYKLLQKLADGGI